MVRVKRCGKSAPAFRVTGVARQTPPEARPRRPHRGVVAQAFEGCSPEPAGRPLEVPGDGVPRWMVAAAPHVGAEQNPAYRPTRPPQACSLHVQLVEPLSVPQPVRSRFSAEYRINRILCPVVRFRPQRRRQHGRADCIIIDRRTGRVGRSPQHASDQTRAHESRWCSGWRAAAGFARCAAGAGYAPPIATTGVLPGMAAGPPKSHPVSERRVHRAS